MKALENHQFATPNERIHVGNASGPEILRERLIKNILMDRP